MEFSQYESRAMDDVQFSLELQLNQKRKTEFPAYYLSGAVE